MCNFVAKFFAKEKRIMIKIGIVGASGYTSSELIRLLISHPGDIKLELVTSRTYEGQSVAKVIPSLKGLVELKFEKFEISKLKERVDFVFLAVPHKVAMNFVPDILKQSIRIVDFSADYRLKDAEVYKDWYHVEHTSPEFIDDAVYGMPELYREEIRNAKLVANPGCYPTGAILGTLPLFKEKLVYTDNIIVDSKSGVSGAGRTPKEAYHLPTRDSNVEAYKIGVHRHIPEIEQELSFYAKTEIKLNFTPHLIPMSRGILTTSYFKLKEQVTTDEVLEVYRDFYKNEPFVRILDKEEYPQTKAVRGSNFCDIGLEVVSRTETVVVSTAIDNLVKGASGTALHNFNIMASLKETAGLLHAPLMP